MVFLFFSSSRGKEEQGGSPRHWRNSLHNTPVDLIHIAGFAAGRQCHKGSTRGESYNPLQRTLRDEGKKS